MEGVAQRATGGPAQVAQQALMLIIPWCALQPQVRWMKEGTALSVPIAGPYAPDRSSVPHPAPPPAQAPEGGRGDHQK
eukprot:15438793-Alexandrium_andersonii.AAC.1